MIIQKYTPPKIEFCTDYGEQPLLLAHVTKDRSMIAVLSLLGGFVAMAAVGFPGALLVGFAALNDISYAAKVDSLDDAPEAAKDDQDAIDVTATTVENDQGANQSIAAAPSMIQSKVLCPIEVLGREPYQSTALIGGQRSGKTYIVALHTQNVKRKFKTKVIYINLYDATGDAADDWTHADVCLTYHIKKLSEGKAKAAIETVTQSVKEFSHQLNVILVFDEWVAFTSKSNAWPKKASQEANTALIDSKAQGGYIAPEGIGTSAIELMNTVMGEAGELGSIGKKQIKALWLIAPSLKAGAIEEQGKVMKELAPMLVAIPPGRSIEWTHPTAGVTQEISFDDAGYRASMGNLGLPRLEDVPAMDCDRMMLLKGTWYSLDNLPPLEKTSTAPIAIPSATIAHLENSYQAAAVEVQIQAVVSTRPDGLDEYPLIGAVWEYLLGKEPRSLKTTADAIRKSGRISMDVLEVKIPHVESFTDGIRQVLDYGIYKGFIVKVSDDAYQAAEKH